MSTIGSVNNSAFPVVTNNYDDIPVNNEAATTQTKPTEKENTATPVTDGIDTSAPKSDKSAVTMTTQGALMDPNYFKSPGMISKGAKYDESGKSSAFITDKVEGHIDNLPKTFGSVEEFNTWINDNLASPTDVTKIWKSWSYDHDHCLDVFAYSVLETFARKGGVCREDAISKTYMLHQLGYEAKAVAYAEPDCFHVVSFFKNDEGTWDIAEYGKIHHLGAASFEEAIVQALPNGNNFWIWSEADADKSAYVEKRVRTHHGLELTNFITGLDQNNGQVIYSDKGISIGLDNEKATLHADFGKGWSADVRYNFSGQEISGFGGNMGGQNGAIWGAVRKEFDNNIKLSLAYSFAPQMGVRDAGDSYSTSMPMQMLALGFSWDKEVYANSWLDGKLRFQSTADAQVSLPFYFHTDFKPESMGMFLLDTEMDVTSHNRLEYDVNDSLTLSAGYTASLDGAHTLANILTSRFKYWAPPAINQYAEIGALFHTDNATLAANLYAPITIFDSKYSDKFTWNVQGSVNVNDRLKLSGSVAGGFTSDNIISKVSAGVTFDDKYSVKFNADGLNTQFKNINVGLSFGINF